jgi:cytochrome c peroxidase
MRAQLSRVTNEWPAIALIAALLTPIACKDGKDSADAKAEPAKRTTQAADAKQAEPGDADEPNGEGADAVAAAWSWGELPKGLFTPPRVPGENPMSAEKVALGHALFMDKRLSVDGTRSCYSCHQNELGNADGLAKAIGPGEKELPRNSPTIWNVAYHGALYWDGRADSLEAQAIGALKGGNMGLGDGLEAKAAEIGALPDYAEKFREAFGLGPDDAVTPDHVAQALSAYERTLLCGGTAHDMQTLDEAQQRGWQLFMGKGGCLTCHNGENFTDGLFHRTGIGVPPGGEPTEESDRGRGAITKDPADDFKFRTPTLRNVSKTAPYFHDGSAKTLEEAVRVMGSGGVPDRGPVDPALLDRQLTDEEVADIVAFLGALDCPGELEIIGDQTVASIPIPPR